MQLIAVRTFDNYFLANIILTRLHAAGIECYLNDEFTVTVDPILTNAIGGIKLVVKATDVALVKEMLHTYDVEYMKAATCPQCGGNQFAYITKPATANYLTAIFTWLFSSFAIAPTFIYQCQQCGYENERLPETFVQQDINEN